VNSPSGSTLQCDTWLWDDMALNSPKRPPYWNSTSGFDFDHITAQSTCHSALVCEILSKSDHPRQKIMTSCQFSKQRVSAILDFRDPLMGSLKSPINLLNCLVFQKIAFLHFGNRRQTDRQTDEQMDMQHRRTEPISLSRAAA